MSSVDDQGRGVQLAQPLSLLDGYGPPGDHASFAPGRYARGAKACGSPHGPTLGVLRGQLEIDSKIFQQNPIIIHGGVS